MDTITLQSVVKSSFKRKIQNGRTWILKKLLKMGDIARQFIKMEVVNGNHTERSFWYEMWSPVGCLKEVVGERGIVAHGIADNAMMADVLTKHIRRRHQMTVDIEDEIDKLRT